MIDLKPGSLNSQEAMREWEEAIENDPVAHGVRFETAVYQGEINHLQERIKTLEWQVDKLIRQLPNR